MKKERIKTTHYRIYDYWKDYGINEKGKIEKFNGNTDSELIPIINDCGEPECWCCGAHNLNNLYTEEDKVTTLKQIWNHKSTKSILQRCHIVPRSLGGVDEPSNYFLLCDRCHRMYPNTISREYFFKWHRAMINSFKKYRDSLINDFMQIAVSDYEKFNKFFVKAYMEKDKSIYNDHGGIVNDSTKAISLLMQIDSYRDGE